MSEWRGENYVCTWLREETCTTVPECVQLWVQRAAVTMNAVPVGMQQMCVRACMYVYKELAALCAAHHHKPSLTHKPHNEKYNLRHAPPGHTHGVQGSLSSG